MAAELPASGLPSRPVASRWLTRDLLLRLMLPLLAIVLLTGGLGGYAADQLTERVYDRWLLDAARSLAHQIQFDKSEATVDLPVEAEAMLAYDETDRTYFSVMQNGRHVAGQRNLPVNGDDSAYYRIGRAFDATYDGQPVRVVAVRVGSDDLSADVLVAETMIKRQRTRQELMWALLPLLALVLSAAAAIEFAVRRTLKPLAAIASNWNAQSHASLSPIAAHDVPSELLPFAGALNDLLARIRGVLDRERQFAATAAHQLRTPLAGLQLGLARAAEAPDLASARAVIRELETATQRTARLVQQLLALSRLDPEAQRDLGFVEADLVELAHGIGFSMMDAALRKGVDLEMVDPGVPIRVRLHPELMTEAIGNLIDNALRYTPRGGRVLIEFEAVPPAVRIADSGPGVPAEHRQAVFERFVRGPGAQGEGSGLGLAIVKEIATLHGAEVTLATSALGGAAFVIRLPKLEG